MPVANPAQPAVPWVGAYTGTISVISGTAITVTGTPWGTLVLVLACYSGVPVVGKTAVCVALSTTGGNNGDPVMGAF